MRLTLMDETFEEEFVYMVVLDAVGHFVVEVPRFAWGHLLNVDRFGAVVAILVLVKW